MTGKFLTATVLYLGVTWLTGTPIDATAATYAVPGDYRSIAEAFSVAQNGDRIEVAPGRYYENGLELPSGITLTGIGDGPGEVIIDGQGLGRILLAEGLDQSTLVANISFVNGRAAGHTNYQRSGGAIFCSNSTLRINNCIFEGNVSDGHGGAIRCNNSTPLITGCVFIDNEAVNGGGGAIDCSFASSPIIRGCEFLSNTAAWGGALSCRGFSSPEISTAMFDGNQAAGTKGYGGAVFADLGSTPVFQQSTYINNVARYGGAIACLEEAETNLENCTVTRNEAQLLGGGMFIYNAEPRINGTIIAFQEGTGITAEGGAAPVVTCSDIFGNTRGDWVGSISAQLGVSNNLSADPLFCGDDEGSIFSLALSDDSPASSPDLACGYMGAWPIGCYTTGATVSSFSARWTNQEGTNQDAQLAWQVRTFGGGELLFRLTGSSADAPDTEWDIAIQDLGGGFYEALDSQTDADRSNTYTYRLYLAEANSAWVLMDKITLASVPDFAGIRELKAWPNPFNPMTTISFRLGQTQRARISVYTLDGRRVVVLAERQFGSGEQTQVWDGRDLHGSGVSSGIYIVLVEGAVDRQTHKITLLK